MKSDRNLYFKQPHARDLSAKIAGRLSADVKLQRNLDQDRNWMHAEFPHSSPY